MQNILYLFVLLLIGRANAQTLEEELACVDDMEVCQAQVSILINSLSNVESYASPGTVLYCDPSTTTEPTAWWVDSLVRWGVPQATADNLRICDNKFWGYLDGTQTRSTCVAFELEEFDAACTGINYYCAHGDVYGYPTHIATAITEAVATPTKVHPQCPRGSCNPISNYWKGIMEGEGVSAEDTEKLCTYDEADLDQYYYVQDDYNILNTCVVKGDTWDNECTANKGRVCSGVFNGLNVVGWPKQQARMVLKALGTSTKNHPQCTVQS